MFNKKVLITLVCFLSFQFALAEPITKPTGAAKFIPIAVGSMTIVIPAPIELDSPIGQAKRFVSAYLSNNLTVMQSITYKASIAKLKEVDDKAREAFKNIYDYQEQIYFAVVIKTRVPEIVILKFYFSWVVNRWVLDRVI